MSDDWKNVVGISPESPREYWLRLARKVARFCHDNENRGREVCETDKNGRPTHCALHEAIATGLAQSFYNGVRAGLEGEPEKGPITKRLQVGTPKVIE